MSSFLSALTPRAEFSLSDVIDEVRELRDENAALKVQVAALTLQAGHGSAAAAADSSSADAATTAATATAVLVPSKVAAAERACVTACLGVEMVELEESLERAKLAGAFEREELLVRCEELGRALEQRVLLAERTQQDAVSAAKRQSADAVAALEEQVAALTEALASRDALAETYGADAELEEAELRLREARVQGEREAQNASALRDELECARARHVDELRAVERDAGSARAEAAQALQALRANESVVQSLKAQLVRLSEGFNKQVEEVLLLQQRLQQQGASTVHKATARSWVINFIENGGTARGDELLRLMAEWWEFSREDCARIGLSDDISPKAEAAMYQPPDASLADSFASFLDAGAEEEAPSLRNKARTTVAADAQAQATGPSSDS